MEARYFDGHTGAAHSVAITHDTERQRLVIDVSGEAGPVFWPLESIRVLDDGGHDILLGTLSDSGARLRVGRPDYGWYRAVCPNLHIQPESARAGRRLLALVAAATVSLVLLIATIVPRLAHDIAPLVPGDVQGRLADQLQNFMAEISPRPKGSSVYCPGSPQSRPALDALVTRIATGAMIEPPAVIVMRSDIPNAFALPQNRVIVLSAMIDKAPSEAAFAGVLAHEFGHLVHHDPMEMLIENSGVGIVISLFTGDVLGTSILAVGAATLVETGFSREREDAADRSAIHTLGAAGIDPKEAASLFDVLAAAEEKQGGLPEFLSTHPNTGRRQALFAAAPAPVIRPFPGGEWASIRDICGD